MNRIQVGFLSGTIAAFAGCLLRFFSKSLARESISPHAWRIDSSRHEMWRELSLILLIFGLVLVVIAWNRWLQSEE